MEPETNPDEQLVKKAVKGNQSAFKTLFNQHFQAVYNFALTLSYDPALAEDLTQEAFIRAHANLDKFGPPWNFRAWLFRLTRNYFIDLTRKDRNEMPLEDGRPVISTQPGPEKQTEFKDAAERVQITLGQMDLDYREILVLREIYHFSYAEIGEILNLTSSNVKVRLHRARGSFQELYGTQLLLDDPSGECLEVAELLPALHDQEAPTNQRRLVREHLKDCTACQKRKDWLVAQSMALSAFVPVIPPRRLARTILQQTVGKGGVKGARKSSLAGKVAGLGGGAAVLGLAGWLAFTLLFNPRSLLKNLPPAPPPPPPAASTPAAVVEEPSPSPSPTLTPTPTYTPTIPADSPPEITEEPAADPLAARCSSLEGLEISLVMLNIPPDTMNLPLYLKIPGGVPGQLSEDLNGEDPWEFSATLGDLEAYKCGLQGFDDRLYCMFNLTPDMPGTGRDFSLYLAPCQEKVYFQGMVAIPELLVVEDEGDSPPVCEVTLPKDECIAAGGDYKRVNDLVWACYCP